MRRFLILVAVAVAATLPALLLRATGWRPSPLLDAAAFGSAILAAGFLLSWGAETAEQHIAQGLILAVVALVTVLPEYAVDLYYAYKAGLEGPESQYVHYAAANMTGANRLLVGLAWPLMVFLHWTKDRHRAVDLASANAVEIGFLLLASLYAFVILFKRSISVVDFAVLAAIFAAYVWRVRNLQKSDNPSEAEEPGPAAALNTLSPAKQWAAIGALVVVACGVILASAEPFAEAMVGTGRAIGLNEFLLIQWLAPLASEAPAISIAVLFVLANRAGDGLIAMISDKINQWTLLVGMLPLALSVGAGAMSPLPLDARQGEEFFLTAAQSLLGIALLLRLRLGLWSALALAGLFAVQVGLAFVYRNDEARSIATLTWLAWVYLGLTGLLFLINGRRLVALVRSALTGRPFEDLSDGKRTDPEQPAGESRVPSTTR
ncbi:sodium:proton exchanger [Methylobacterium aquaticum]|uniref:sodium:proton exchanger n=1 Tax=Methylobacterium aquaticum TaxID=270351 RepID=UPI0009E6174A|nr:sodium:proton exchanger [Methylobacterium aquaticum]